MLNDIINKVIAAVLIDFLSDTYLDLQSESIVPVVRHKEFYRQMVEMGFNGVSIPLNEELVLLFAVDDSLSIRYLVREEFEKLEVTVEILEIASVLNLE